MQHAGSVDKRQRIDQWREQLVHLLLAGPAREPIQPGVEVLAMDVVEDNVGGVVGIEGAKDTHDIRMAEACEQPPFLHKPFQAPLEASAKLLTHPHSERGVAMRDLAGKVFLDSNV